MTQQIFFLLIITIYLFTCEFDVWLLGFPFNFVLNNKYFIKEICLCDEMYDLSRRKLVNFVFMLDSWNVYETHVM